jgi:photosystem II stability/assembly factor-like uncharacterized protein
MATAAEGEWINLGLEGAQIVSLAVHPADSATIYAGTDGVGVLKSTNGGGSWTLVNDGLTHPEVRALAIDPGSPATLYAGTDGGGIFKTTDGGASWSAFNEGLTAAADLRVWALAVDPVNPATLYAKTWSGSIFKSTDGGLNWDLVNTGQGRVFALALRSATLYAASTSDGVVKTTDGGANWSAAGAGLPDVAVGALALHPTTLDTVYAGTYSGVYKSIDGGASWSAVGLTDRDVDCLTIDPTSPDTLYAGMYGGVFKTTDGGQNWSAMSTGLPGGYINALGLDPAAPDTLYAGTPAGTFKTTDGAASWSAASGGVTAPYVNTLVLHPTASDTLYVGTDGGLFKTTDAGSSWSMVNGPAGPVFSLAIDPTAPDTVYVGVLDNLFKTTDGGASWTAVNDGLSSGGYSATPVALAIDPTAPDTLYAGTSFGVFKTTDGGASWIEMNTGLTNNDVAALAIDPTAPDTLYAGTYAGVFKTTTAGGSWSATSMGLNTYALTLDPTNPAVVYSGGTAGVFKTSDGGINWVPVNTGLPTALAYTLAFDPSSPATVYAGTPDGVFGSATGGASWSAVGTGLAPRHVRALAVIPNDIRMLYAGTTGGVFVLREEPEPPAPTATLVSPKNTVIDTTPTYTWNALPGVTHYYLWVDDSGTQGKVKALYTAAQAGCAAGTGTCSVTPTTALAIGPGQWWIRAWGAAGYGPWSASLSFQVNRRPAVPASRGQRKSDGTTVIPLGGTVPPPTVVFRGTVSDSDAGQQVKLQVEVKPLGANFTGTVSCQSELVASGTVATCAVSTLALGGYHWRTRTVDSLGTASNWISFATNPETAEDFVVNTPPAFPVSRGQRQADGTTPIPLGGTALTSTVRFQGTVSDPDPGQQVRLQVEVKPVGTAFIGTVSCESTPVSSGTATCAVNSLALGTNYHWRTRTVDSLGTASAWASYATNAETEADFAVHRAPAVPAARGQLQANGTTAIPLGGTATSTTVVFRGTVSDPDAGQMVGLEVEVQPLGAAFTGAVSCQSGLVPSGTAATCSMSSLAPGASYHWRLRAVDGGGAASAWASYATNSEDAADFTVAP